MRLTNRPAHWWGGAAGYEIYVPSFADGNSDGMGDLLGVVDRLDYQSGGRCCGRHVGAKQGRG